MELKDGKKTFYAKNGKAWRAWLQKNGEKKKAFWLIMYHKGKGKPSVYYAEAVEEALCFGWIDSKPNKRDGESYYQFFSRRNPKSKWSAVNKKRVEELVKDGRMAPQGLAVIELAKKNGAWFALDEVEKLTMPADLKKAFAKAKKAAGYFKAFPPSVKKALFQWISDAKTAETKIKRITETVTLAAENKRANQYVRK